MKEEECGVFEEEEEEDSGGRVCKGVRMEDGGGQLSPTFFRGFRV